MSDMSQPTANGRQRQRNKILDSRNNYITSKKETTKHKKWKME